MGWNIEGRKEDKGLDWQSRLHTDCKWSELHFSSVYWGFSLLSRNYNILTSWSELIHGKNWECIRGKPVKRLVIKIYTHVWYHWFIICHIWLLYVIAIRTFDSNYQWFIVHGYLTITYY
jgi:hypothetical protein